MQTLARGALAGLVATVPITVVIGAGSAAGLLRTPPPVEITETVAEQVGEDPDRRSPAFQVGWLSAHSVSSLTPDTATRIEWITA